MKKTYDIYRTELFGDDNVRAFKKEAQKLIDTCERRMELPSSRYNPEDEHWGERAIVFIGNYVHRMRRMEAIGKMYDYVSSDYLGYGSEHGKTRMNEGLISDLINDLLDLASEYGYE